MKRIFCLMATLLVGTLWAYAQPDWAVNLLDYEKRMSVTAVLFFDGAESRDGQDMVAAFIDGEVRGVGRPDTYYAQDDRYLVLFQIGDNQVSGSTITFRVYDASTDTEYPVEQTLTFVAESNTGTVSNPYLFTNNYLPNGLHLSENSVSELAAPGTGIGTFSTTDPDAADTFTYRLVYDELLGPDSAAFTIDGDILRTAEAFDYEARHRYEILVRTTDQKGGSYEAPFVIRIVDGNEPPTELLLDNLRLAEAQPAGTVVGRFSTTDPDSADQFTYTLTGARVDNEAFAIADDYLVTAVELDREQQPDYRIEVTTTDQGGETYVQTFTIVVVDQNEAPQLADARFSILENREQGFVVGILTASDIDEGQGLSYRILLPDPLAFIEEFPFAIGAQSGEITVNQPYSIDFETKETHRFLVEVTDNGPMALTDTAEVTIRITDEPEGILPANDLVSPNGDGFNDLWRIRNVEVYADYRLTIFSAEGHVVFQAQPYTNDWDGTYQGQRLPNGIYYYLFQNPEGFTYRGMINLKDQ